MEGVDAISRKPDKSTDGFLNVTAVKKRILKCNSALICILQVYRNTVFDILKSIQLFVTLPVFKSSISNHLSIF